MNDDFEFKKNRDSTIFDKFYLSKLCDLSSRGPDGLAFLAVDPVLSVKRTGNYTFQLNSGVNGGNLSLDSQGIIPERRFSYSGNEQASDLPAQNKFGKISVFNTRDSIESVEFENIPMQHPSGNEYLFSSARPTFAVQRTGALIRGGLKVVGPEQEPVATRVDGGFEVTTSQTFIYKGAGDEQIFIMWRIPLPWDDGSILPDSPRELGTFTIIVTNVSQNRFVFGRNGLEVQGGKPGTLVYSALELELKRDFPWISANETIKVDLIHKCYSSTTGAQDYKLIGASSGFVLLNARPKN